MIKISREELLKIARISYVHIQEDEIPGLLRQLHDVLTYARRVNTIAKMDVIDASYKNVNVFRDDLVYKTDVKPLIAQAPQHERNYFVVPAILENEG